MVVEVLAPRMRAPPPMAVSRALPCVVELWAPRVPLLMKQRAPLAPWPVEEEVQASLVPSPVHWWCATKGVDEVRASATMEMAAMVVTVSCETPAMEDKGMASFPLEVTTSTTTSAVGKRENEESVLLCKEM